MSDEALKALNIPTQGVGKYGGNLNNPLQQPEARRASYNGAISESGVPLLHRLKTHDSANCGVQNEKPWHHMAAHMLVMNMSHDTIAKAAGVTPGCITQLKSNVWFQELLASITRKAGQSISERLNAEANASIDKLVSLRDNAESERVQLTAANLLLEQAHGKAVQKTISVTQALPAGSLKQRYDDIQSELSAIAKARQSRESTSEAGLPPVGNGQS